MRASFPSLSRAVAIFGGSAACFALALWGEGGFQPFLDHSARSALAVGFLIVVVGSLFSGGNLSREPSPDPIQSDRGSS